MKKKIISIIIIAALGIGMGGGGYCFNRLMRHERAQSLQISNLQGQISLLQLKVANHNTWHTSEDGFDYLAIGNSITRHGLCDYWWGEWGMAASTASNDYFTLVSSSLQKKFEAVNCHRINFSVWERLAHDRSETWEVLDPYLNENVDLVTIQLSENALDLITFKDDLSSLLKHIKVLCPKSTIIVVDDFWSDEKSKLKKQACKENNIPFADLSDIRGKKEYQGRRGTMVMGADGKEHKIEHSGVAIHPGDEGMKVIAERVLYLQNNTKE